MQYNITRITKMTVYFRHFLFYSKYFVKLDLKYTIRLVLGDDMQLRKMQLERFESWKIAAIKEFAKGKVENGEWPQAESYQLSKEELNTILPEGYQTPHHYFYDMVVDDQIVGNIWLSIADQVPTTAYILDIGVFPDFQDLGYGSTALKLIASEAKMRQCQAIKLHVFGKNKRAIHVYQKNGFEMTDIEMVMKL
ncbi:MAG: GNAT family N-acetyltransferase [Pseudolactococcus laudensis]